MDAIAETWLAVVGFEGLYEVSDLGRLRSLDRVVRGKSDSRVLKRGKILSTKPGHLGYPQATLCLRDTTKQQKFVHALVADAFLGPHAGRLVRHLNDVKTDNRLVNLAYGTYSDNAFDAVRNGCHATASKTHCPAGHPYDALNTYSSPAGERRCRTCKRILDRSYRARRRAHV